MRECQNNATVRKNAEESRNAKIKTAEPYVLDERNRSGAAQISSKAWQGCGLGIKL